jgi:hypothetical protein
VLGLLHLERMRMHVRRRSDPSSEHPEIEEDSRASFIYERRNGPNAWRLLVKSSFLVVLDIAPVTKRRLRRKFA